MKEDPTLTASYNASLTRQAVVEKGSSQLLWLLGTWHTLRAYKAKIEERMNLDPESLKT